MAVEFVQLRDDGTIDARLGPQWPVFNEALADAITSIPPRGSDERRPSTYWINQTLEMLGRMRAAGEEGRIASGNAYSIVLGTEGVTAVFDYGNDDEPPERMTVETFVDLLERWRAAVVEVQRHEFREIPETSRRNPWP